MSEPRVNASKGSKFKLNSNARKIAATGLALTLLALGTGGYVYGAVYNPQKEIVENLEGLASEDSQPAIDFYGDERSIAFEKDPFFESDTWQEYYAITEPGRDAAKQLEVDAFAANADGVTFPGLKDRAGDAVSKYVETQNNSEYDGFEHFLRAATATTLACDASHADHVVTSMEAEGHEGESEEEHAEHAEHPELSVEERKAATEEFIENWSMDEWPMAAIATHNIPEPTEEEKEIIHEAFTEAMKVGLPYYCP